MPKMKSNRGASKSFRKTASGGYKRKKANKSHILTSKDRKTKRNLRRPTMVSDADLKSVKLMVH